MFVFFFIIIVIFMYCSKQETKYCYLNFNLLYYGSSGSTNDNVSIY